MKIPQLRRNSPFGQWRVYSERRGSRPHINRIDINSCPFERGKEHELPKKDDGSLNVLYRCPEENGIPWEILVVPNKFPFLMIEGRPFRSDGDFNFQGNGLWQMLEATGAHEVFIESPDHFEEFHNFPVWRASAIIKAACLRYGDLRQDRRMRYYTHIRNVGPSSGASIYHPHSQGYASVIVPAGAQEVLSEYWQYREATRGACLYCEHVKAVEKLKSSEESLFVSENDYCIAFVPYAPEYLFEVWIVPRPEYCNCSFAYTLLEHEQRREAVARMQIDVTRRLSMLLSEQSARLNYNMIFRTAPYDEDDKNGSFHWHIRFHPRGYQIDGSIEVADKLPIRPMLPEQWASMMRLLDLKHGDIL